MQTRHLFFLLLLVSSHSLSWSILAQDKQAAVSRSLERKEAGRPECEALLEEVIRESGALKLAENRAWVQAQAAAVLWKRDEARARRLFGQALDSLEETAAEVDDGWPDERLRQRTSELRRDILRLVAGYDVELKRMYWRGARQADYTDEEAELDLEAATLVAGENPRQAARLARESISNKVSFGVVALVARLQKHDPESAAGLASQIIDRLKSEDLSSNTEAAGVAAELLRMSLKGEGAPRRAGATEPTLTLRPQDSRALAEMLAASALRASPSQPTLLLALQPMLSHMEGFVPSLAPRLRRQVDALNAFAAEAPGADVLTVAEPDAQPPVADGQPRPSEERFAEIIGRARAAAERGDKTVALQLLDEAGVMARVFTRARNYDRLNSQSEVALAYLGVDPDKGFDIFESLIAQLNELAAAAVGADGFLTDSDGTLARREELLLREVQAFVARHHHAERLHLFARANFARTLNAVDKLHRPEVRVMARLLIARCEVSHDHPPDPGQYPSEDSN